MHIDIPGSKASLAFSIFDELKYSQIVDVPNLVIQDLLFTVTFSFLVSVYIRQIEIGSMSRVFVKTWRDQNFMMT